jgi:multidrug efflux pump subunit AcrA (membrane-fusion protein)
MKQPGELKEQKILAGMAGVAHISGRAPGETSGGYVIPVSAFKGDPKSNQSHLWVVGEDNRVSSREVKVGRLTDGGVLVTEGLQAGDLVATAGVHVLSEGQEVIVDRTGG